MNCGSPFMNVQVYLTLSCTFNIDNGSNNYVQFKGVSRRDKRKKDYH